MHLAYVVFVPVSNLEYWVLSGEESDDIDGCADIADGTASLWLIDDDCGTVLKRIPLFSSWDDDDVKDIQIVVDLEMIIQTVTTLNGNSFVYVYELDRRKKEFLEEPKQKKPKGKLVEKKTKKRKKINY